MRWALSYTRSRFMADWEVEMKRPSVEAEMERIECEETKIRMTEAAIAEVDQNALIAHQDMLSWAESLDTANPIHPPE